MLDSETDFFQAFLQDDIEASVEHELHLFRVRGACEMGVDVLRPILVRSFEFPFQELRACFIRVRT